MRAPLIAILALLLGAAPAAAPFDAAGYRTERYRGPIDRDAAPAPRLALPAVRQLDPAKDAIFIDVMPAEGGVRDAASGRWRLAEEHQTIPGATWYPETGRGAVDRVLWRGLRAGVARQRRARPRAPVIVFCRVDCWMSWNAARRLARDGVSNVWWFAEGIDGWREAGGALVTATPVVTR